MIPGKDSSSGPCTLLASTVGPGLASCWPSAAETQPRGPSCPAPHGASALLPRLGLTQEESAWSRFPLSKVPLFPCGVCLCAFLLLLWVSSSSGIQPELGYARELLRVHARVDVVGGTQYGEPVCTMSQGVWDAGRVFTTLAPSVRLGRAAALVSTDHLSRGHCPDGAMLSGQVGAVAPALAQECPSCLAVEDAHASLLKGSGKQTVWRGYLVRGGYCTMGCERKTWERAALSEAG